MTEINSSDNRTGSKIKRLIEELYPICRSITGNGVRQSLQILKRLVPLDIHEVPTGTQVYDWTVPREWNISDAYIITPEGRKIASLKDSNIHVVNYSVPVHKKISLSELKDHIHTLPDQPDLIPYRTSYYQDNWGFCLTHNELVGLTEGEYEVFIDSTLESGSLTYGEYYKKGQISKEILLTSYICHPSLCNDNLSGPALLATLAEKISNKETRYSYRFLFIPETIGAIAWLKSNTSALSNIIGGYVATCVGDAGKFTYKLSRREDAYTDRVALQVLRDIGEDHAISKFDPSNGSDERQFSSQAFDIPMGSLMRTQYGNFSQYHTSGDDLSFMSGDALDGSLDAYMQIIDIIEGDAVYKNLNPECEPQLGKRGLYRDLSTPNMPFNMAGLFWVLNFSDGKNSLLDIAERSELKFAQIRKAADHLFEAGLLSEIEPE